MTECEKINLKYYLLHHCVHACTFPQELLHLVVVGVARLPNDKRGARSQGRTHIRKIHVYAAATHTRARG